MKKFIPLMLFLFMQSSVNVNAAWLFEEKEIGGDSFYDSFDDIIIMRSNLLSDKEDYELNIYDYSGRLNAENVRSEYYEKCYSPRKKEEPTPVPSLEPTSSPQPYTAKENDAVGFTELDGKYAAVNSVGERLSGYVYDDVLHNFDPEELMPRITQKLMYTPGGPHDPWEGFRDYEICTNRIYAKVVQDGAVKFINPDLSEIDRTSEPLFNHLDPINDRFAFATLYYWDKDKENDGEYVAVCDISENKVTYFMEDDIHVTGICNDRQHFMYRNKGELDIRNLKRGIMDLYGNRTAEGRWLNMGAMKNSERYVSFEGNKWGVIDVDGNIIVKPEYDFELTYSNGVFRVFDWRTDGFMDMLDTSGNSIFAYSNMDGYRDLERAGYFLAHDKDGHYKLLKRVEELPVLYTDVKANINGYEIPCYSANSCCVITAEDLRGYGFDVVWDGEARTLNIWRNSEYYNVNPVDIPSGAPVSGEYKTAVPTDIKTYFNGKRIPTYAVDGVTMIKPEDIAEDGITFDYDDTKRSLSISVDGLAMVFE